jgi:hypothetical protein
MKTLSVITFLILSFNLHSQKTDSIVSDFEVSLNIKAPRIHSNGIVADSSKHYANNIDLTIINLSGIDIDSLKIGETFIGEVAKEDTTKVKVEGIIKMLSTGEPYKLNAILKDSTGIDPSPILTCSTNSYYLKNGTYTFYLVKVEWTNGAKVFWSTNRE